jgi:hypothetical protein
LGLRMKLGSGRFLLETMRTMACSFVILDKKK